MTGIGPYNFLVRWSGQVQAVESGTYTFTTLTDDGVGLWVGGDTSGAPLIGQWIDQAATYWQGSIALNAGQKYNLAMNYYQKGGGAVARLFWTRPGQQLEIIPQSQLFPDMAATVSKLSGTVIGTSGSWGNNGNDRSKAFDGDTGTFFDAPGPDGNWTGPRFGKR